MIDKPQPLTRIVPSVGSLDLARTHFTFTNPGPGVALSVAVDTLRLGGQAMNFETIDELRPGASLTRLAIIYPVVSNDPHWSFDFWTASGEEFALPFVIRYRDANGQAIVARNILKWDGHRVFLLPDEPTQLAEPEGNT